MSRQLLLLVLVVAATVCGVHCLSPLIRAGDGDYTTGRYIAVLEETTSHERQLEIVDQLEERTEGSKVHGYVETAVRAITLELSNEALEKVSVRRSCMQRHVLTLQLSNEALQEVCFLSNLAVPSHSSAYRRRPKLN